MTDLSGTTLADRYDLLELVGAGGMGAVYRARDRELDELVALKVIRAELACDPAIVDRFRAEVKLARRVTHRNVARTFELGRAGDVLYCTMELVDGEPLARRLARGALPAAEAVAIACALCDGLGAAHAAGVIHRDIKPDNVLVARDGRVVLADFGVAALEVARGDLSGTPAYMAPEQARGEPPAPAVDVYSVGVVLYELLAGRRADVHAERLVPVGPDIPEALAEIVGRATAHDRAARLATADALRRALAPFAQERVAPAAPRVVGNAADLRTVIAIAPRGGGALYVAEAVYTELLARLARRPRVRVRAQTAAIRDAIVVALEADDTLVATIADPFGATTTLVLPLAPEHVAADADAIANAVGVAVGAASEHTPAERDRAEAYELLLRAQHLSRSDRLRALEARGLLERAHALAPDDPRIAAALAMVGVRRLFLLPEATHDDLRAVAELARAAVAAAPDLHAAQLAAGQLALHVGDPVAAAGSFRRAITCAPLAADAHEYLGLMLLEAGYIDVALARLDEAIAIEPGRISARWEIARALALEGRWDEHDRLVEQLVAPGTERTVSRLRFASWRGDLAQMAALAHELLPAFDAELATALMDIYLAPRWAERKDVLVARTRIAWPDARRRAYVAQLVAEAAGHAGDVDTCVAMLAHAVEQGLFDLHWLDRCPLLASARGAPGFAPLRARVKARADAILDALYGDHVVESTSATVLATHA